MRRSVRDDIRLYGTLLGLSLSECDAMADGGTRNARIACARELRERYRRENEVDAAKKLSGLRQLEFWRESTEVPRFVYFIQSGGRGPVKIGIAVDPIKRMRDLQTGNPSALHLRHVVPGDRELESELHFRFREARIRGEWFGLAYLRLILIYAEGFAAQHVECFQREHLLPQVVEGHRIVSPAREAEMRRDLARLLERYDYWPDVFGAGSGRREVDQIMKREYGIDGDEVERLAWSLRSKRIAIPQRPFRRGRKRPVYPVISRGGHDPDANRS